MQTENMYNTPWQVVFKILIPVSCSCEFFCTKNCPFYISMSNLFIYIQTLQRVFNVRFEGIKIYNEHNGHSNDEILCPYNL